MLQVSGNTLQQVETFKYLGMIFTNDERRHKKIDTGIGKANAVFRDLYCFVVTKGSIQTLQSCQFYISLCSDPHVWS